MEWHCSLGEEFRTASTKEKYLQRHLKTFKALAVQEVHGTLEEMEIGLQRLSNEHEVRFSPGENRATGGIAYTKLALMLLRRSRQRSIWLEGQCG
eukprot:11154320-Karenia_brevis.AAC.1